MDEKPSDDYYRAGLYQEALQNNPPIVLTRHKNGKPKRKKYDDTQTAFRSFITRRYNKRQRVRYRAREVGDNVPVDNKEVLSFQTESPDKR